jgi:hypothetical protein
LLLPFQWFIEGTRPEILLGWIWFAVLMIPVGYWCLHMNAPAWSLEANRQWAAVVLGGAAFLCVGLVVVPMMFGLHAAPFGDWVATLVGILIGTGLGALAGAGHWEDQVSGGSPNR